MKVNLALLTLIIFTVTVCGFYHNSKIIAYSENDFFVQATGEVGLLKQKLEGSGAWRDNDIDYDKILKTKLYGISMPFVLEYGEVAYISNGIMQKLLSKKVNAKIVGVEVKGSESKVEVVFDAEIYVNTNSFFAVMMGIKDKTLQAKAVFTAILSEGCITRPPEIMCEKYKPGASILSYGSVYAFGDKNYNSILLSVANAVLYNVGKPISFSETGIIIEPY